MYVVATLVGSVLFGLGFTAAIDICVWRVPSRPLMSFSRRRRAAVLNAVVEKVERGELDVRAGIEEWQRGVGAESCCRVFREAFDPIEAAAHRYTARRIIATMAADPSIN